MNDQPRRLKKIKGVNLFEVTIKGLRYWRVVSPKPGKGRYSRTFGDKTQARNYYEQQVQLTRNLGRAAGALSARQRLDALGALEALRVFPDATLLGAVEFYVKHHVAIGGSVTVSEAISQLLSAKKADGKSVRYLGDLRARLARFAFDFGEQKIAEIDSPEIGDWLRSLPLGPRSRNTYHTRLTTLFKYAIEQRWTLDNPVTKSTLAKTYKAKVGVLTPQEYASLLFGASDETRPFLVLGGFAGIRSAEILRLSWSDLDWGNRLVKIDDEQSKTARQRFVELPEAALRWLEPYRGSRGRICPIGGSHLYDRLAIDRKQAGIASWPSNALRHSYASYHLAFHNDAGKLSLQLGHMKSQTVFEHYRLRVLPTEAAIWWSIYPDQGSNVIQIPARANG
jgi:integrase